VYRLGVVGHHPRLALAQGMDGGTVLAIAVGRLVTVRVGDGKSPYAKPGQRHQVNPADAAQTGNGHATAAQACLFRRLEQPLMAGERLLITPTLGGTS